MKDYISILNKARKEKTGETLMDSTKERYIYLISPFEKKLRACDKSNIVDYINKMLQDRGSMGLYSAFRYWLIMLGDDPRNKEGLINKIYLPKNRATSMSSMRKLQSKVLTRQQLKMFFDNIPNNYHLLLFKILYDTACRREELCSIKFKHISYFDDLKDKNMIENGIFAEVFLQARKGGRTGSVYLSEETVKILKNYVKDDEENIVNFKVNNKPYRDQAHQLYLCCLNYGKEILSLHLHPHMFRHTRLQHMADLGVPALEIMSYAGHKDIKATMIYVHNSKFQSKNAFIHAYRNSQ
jgi:integrase